VEDINSSKNNYYFEDVLGQQRKIKAEEF